MRVIQIQCIILLITIHPAVSQYTLTGLRGMVSVPHAEIVEDRGVMVGMQTSDRKYKLHQSNSSENVGNEKIYSINIGFIKRINILVNLTRVDGVRDSLGIGDREAQLTYLLVKERNKFPSIALNVSLPDISGQQYLAGNHLVATKGLQVSPHWEVKSSVGYGIPYIYSSEGASSELFIRKRTDFLTGIFGGMEWTYDEMVSVSMEYDGRSWNTGISALVVDQLSLDLNLQGMHRFEFGINYVGIIK